MCGIAGILQADRTYSEQTLRRMLARLAHRGPDAEGVWQEPESEAVMLGHRRLAILDLTAASEQPMLSASGRFVLTYNGEVYNYLELRRHLEAKGYTFRTTGDTEVLANALEHYGMDCLSMIDGMFAFAVWDRQERTLGCARDRFGEKPFHYAFSPGRHFVFASEIKALWEAGVDRAVNLRMVGQYLRTGGMPIDRANPSATFYEHVSKLESGSTLLLDASCRLVSKRKYWELPSGEVGGDGAPADPVSEEEVVERFGELFADSLRCRMRSDVPVGSSLSGGLDSSSIVCAIARDRAAGQMQHTFSARFDGFEKDEGRYMEEVIRQTGVEGHFVWPSGEQLVQDLERLFYHQDEPFISTSIYAQWCVMREAHTQGVTVLLDGQGADESLAGYPYYAEAALQGSPFPAVQGLSLGLGLREAVEPAVTTARRTAGKALRTLGLRRGGTWANPDFAHAYMAVPRARRHQPPPPIQALQRRDLVNGSMETLLRYADRNSMAHSREVRLPYLSHKLVEFGYTLPDHFKVRDGWTKYVLRKHAERSVPERIVWRTDKVAYETPEARWLADDYYRGLLSDSVTRMTAEGILDPHWKGGYDLQSWQLIMAGMLFKG